MNDTDLRSLFGSMSSFFNLSEPRYRENLIASINDGFAMFR
jgi:hypothetical protein